MAKLVIHTKETETELQNAYIISMIEYDITGTYRPKTECVVLGNIMPDVEFLTDIAIKTCLFASAYSHKQPGYIDAVNDNEEIFHLSDAAIIFNLDNNMVTTVGLAGEPHRCGHFLLALYKMKNLKPDHHILSLLKAGRDPTDYEKLKFALRQIQEGIAIIHTENIQDIDDLYSYGLIKSNVIPREQLLHCQNYQLDQYGYLRIAKKDVLWDICYSAKNLIKMASAIKKNQIIGFSNFVPQHKSYKEY